MSYLIDFLVQNGALLGVLASIATIFGVAFGLYKASHDRQVQALNQRISELQQELERQGTGNTAILQQRIDDLIAEREILRVERDDLERQRDRNQVTIDEITVEAEETRSEIVQMERRRTNLLRQAMDLEGRVWMRRVLQGATRFRPLSERNHMPIISILNLKGGVGKTTITAHLAAALVAKGLRVLMIDLDLQGSLSGLFLKETLLAEHSVRRGLLQHFLTAAAEGGGANLLPFCAPAKALGGQSGIVPTADSMAYAELNLTMRWLLRVGTRDTRFLLRRGLHQRRITNRFDVVLIDCPPLFNTCCVNALAASDYVIIPTTPSRQATERVPLLLERLQQLTSIINPQLQVAGLLLNRTHYRVNITTDLLGATRIPTPHLAPLEHDIWQQLQVACRDRWRSPVPVFSNHIRNIAGEVRACEEDFVPPTAGSELFEVFACLVDELRRRLPGDCLRTPNTSSRSREVPPSV